MPVKLSGPLVAEARESAKLFRRSLTGQIEHWATLGRAMEARLPADALVAFLRDDQKPLKIAGVAGPAQRAQVMNILAEFLDKPSTSKNHPWLAELSAKGIPVYGTKPGESEIISKNAAGKKRASSSKRNR